jgi:hypothetical protein
VGGHKEALRVTERALRKEYDTTSSGKRQAKQQRHCRENDENDLARADRGAWPTSHNEAPKRSNDRGASVGERLHLMRAPTEFLGEFVAGTGMSAG